MKIKLCRIDDRLIHGQVATVWAHEANAERIIIAVMKLLAMRSAGLF